MSVAKILWRGK